MNLPRQRLVADACLNAQPVVSSYGFRVRFPAKAGRRFLLVLWFSIALHLALIGLFQVSPPSVPRPKADLLVQMQSGTVAPTPDLPESARKQVHEKPAVTPTRTLVQTASPQTAPLRQLAVTVPSPVMVSPQAPAPRVDMSATVAQPVPTQPAPIQPETPARPPAALPDSHDVMTLPQIEDSRYYAVKELDGLPRPLRRLEPVYPPQADEQSIPGRVTLKLHLESDGHISQTEVSAVEPANAYGELFRRSALEAVKNLQFRPAMRNGVPVRALMEYRITFDPERASGS